ncbi:LPS export ABC transporter periplasmic protein LptC [Candidatus Pelagibacter sp.]|nr:LPS export ABC transporter periplasmic protein LptC [Candidatus Pelagibacter sp.]
MNQKNLIQLIIFLLIVTISISVYLNYFNNDTKSLKINSNAIKTDNKKDENSNYIENINYTSEVSENKYQITAERAKIKIDSPDIMFLENLVAYITIKDSSIIKVTSDFGKYNSKNYDTVFSKNVVATYPGHKITGEYLDFSLINNIGIFSTNIFYVSDKTKMFADKIEINLITNDTRIFMFDKSNKVLFESIN